jgi:hypothetical protein
VHVSYRTSRRFIAADARGEDVPRVMALARIGAAAGDVSSGTAHAGMFGASKSRHTGKPLGCASSARS